MIKKIAVGLLCILPVLANAGWELRQVNIKHLQVGTAKGMYMTVDANTSSSGCSSHNGWVKLDFSDPVVSSYTKEFIGLAMMAYTSKTPVDIGSKTSGCVDGYARIQYIRVGNYE